jgi:acrylyl-CoA reductase (NADPH)
LALNYKDGLAAAGNPGVARKFPLIPGVDAVGVVLESGDEQFSIGDEVLIGHAKFGTAHHGGFAKLARVPAGWVYRLPAGLTPLDAVTLGTAGFTAARSVEKIVNHGIKPEDGDVLVTGATGGVGVLAVKLLAQLGYRVVASTGKVDKHEWLKRLGAAEVITREQTCNLSEAPLLKGRWAAIVDTVGGSTLASVLREADLHSCVTTCGNVAGTVLATTVFPFILRGITLCGIDSANTGRDDRIQVWNKLAGDWKMDLGEIRSEVGLEGLPEEIMKILNGKIFGRSIINMDR